MAHQSGGRGDRPRVHRRAPKPEPDELHELRASRLPGEQDVVGVHRARGEPAPAQRLQRRADLPGDRPPALLVEGSGGEGGGQAGAAD
ncbi:MAG: hypothetical protein L0I24_18870 [Pseudonocardia sp.]|nr:hypothetical protein [Pseudonocardia sp.]